MDFNSIHIIIGEIQNVVAAMRLNSRWSGNGAAAHLVGGAAENPLLKAFKNLRNTLDTVTDFPKLDVVTYLTPFLNIIHSEEANGPITGVALSSVHKFLTYGFITENSPNVAKAMVRIAETVTHCRFEATDPDSDEVVLMRILRVLLACLRCPAGCLLTDDLVYETVQTCYRMSIQLRLSELLRRTAEHTLIEMLQTIFMTIPNTPIKTPEPETEVSQPVVITNPRGIQFQKNSSETEIVAPRPYGLPCLIRLFRFACSLISPAAADGNTETMRHLGLRLVNTILETRGSRFVNHPNLLAIVKDELCKFLLQNLTTDNLPILALTLRVFFNLFTTLKSHMKFQMEVFFNNILICIMENKTASFEKQEIALECLVEFCREPSFMVDLYVNYDCYLHCTNLFENLCKFLYKNAFPVSGSLYLTNILSLDGLLAVVQSITDRCRNPGESKDSTAMLKDVIDAETVRKSKQKKGWLAQAAEAFSRSPDEAFELLQGCGFWGGPPDAAMVGSFLRNTPGLDKKKVGEYLGKNKPFVLEVLDAYVATFDFKNAKFNDAVRTFLQSFRLPPEAQMISRILEAFAKHYYDSNPNTGLYPDPDAVFLMTFAAIMLHSDHYNDNVKNKMTKDQYFKNCHGIPGLKELPNEVMDEIFQDITSQEIKIPDEFPGGEITNTRWKDLLSRTNLVGSFVSGFNGIFDKEIFSIIKSPVIAAISVVFDTAYDDAIIQKALDGFNLCAQISAHYNMSDVFDNLVISLCKFSTLLAPPVGTAPVANFGKNKKAQLALITAFSITRKYGDHLREGWRNLVHCIFTLHKLDLLPTLTELTTFSSPVARRTPVQRAERASILSTITVGWFGSSEPTKEEPNESDVEAEKLSAECVKQCFIKEVINESKYLQADSLISFVKALIQGRDQRTVSTPSLQASPAPTQFQKKPSSSLSTNSLAAVWDDSTAMLSLEILTQITLLNQDRIVYLWMLIYEHFASFITSAVNPSPVVDKAIMLVLILCGQLIRRAELSDQIQRFVQLLSKLHPSVVESASENIAVGVSKLLQNALDIRNDVTWRTLFGLLESLAEHNSSSGIAFNTLCSFMSTHQHISKDNYLPCLNAILAFSSKHCNSNCAIKAMELMNTLYSCASTFIVADSPSSSIGNEQEVWTGYWLPVLQGFCCLCRDSRQDVRNYAMTYLQRTLLSSDIQRLSPEGWRNCFEQILFPLLTELLKPFSGGESNSIGIEETRLRASVLLSKIFLQYLPKLTELTDFHKLWLQILHFIEIYMKADHSDLLAEAIPEALKNILLVMTATGILQPGVKTTSGEDIWQLSWTAIDAFCPSLREELQPPRPTSVASTPSLPTSSLPHSSPPPHAQSTPTIVSGSSSPLRATPPASPSLPSASTALTTSSSPSSSPSTPISYSPSSSMNSLPSSPAPVSSPPTGSLSSSTIIERDFVVVEADGPITFI